ncbi:hypothetical protein MRX96_031810 [Rhipicephalus microplus]
MRPVSQCASAFDSPAKQRLDERRAANAFERRRKKTMRRLGGQVLAFGGPFWNPGCVREDRPGQSYSNCLPHHRTASFSFVVVHEPSGSVTLLFFSFHSGREARLTEKKAAADTGSACMAYPINQSTVSRRYSGSLSSLAFGCYATAENDFSSTAARRRQHRSTLNMADFTHRSDSCAASAIDGETSLKSADFGFHTRFSVAR